MIKGLFFVVLLSLQSLALDIGTIKIMRDNGVEIAFSNEIKAHTISKSTTPRDLIKVIYLKLNGLYLRKIPSWLPKMTNIVKLELEKTNIDLIDLSVLSSLTNLNTLNLNNNPKLFKKGGNLNKLLKFFSLSELYLANTGGDSSDYSNIGNNKSLIKLDISNNSISSINSLHLEKLSSLKELKITGNSLSGTLDTSYLPKRSLTYLNLSYNNISRLTFSDDFPVLESLHISNNDSYLEFDEDWNDALILGALVKGKSSFNEGIALPTSIMKRLGIKSKWIDVSSSTCLANGGKMKEGVCDATWKNAKKICNISGGVLPTIDELKNVVKDCGGINTTLGDTDYKRLRDKNKANKSYQKCYKLKAFKSNYNWYWSSTTYPNDSSNAWVVIFYSGNDLNYDKGNDNLVRCVRDGQ